MENALILLNRQKLFNVLYGKQFRFDREKVPEEIGTLREKMTLWAFHTYNVEAKNIEKFVKGKGVLYIHVKTDDSPENMG